MTYRKITAIVRQDALENVEKKLTEIGVQGISVSQIKGYGEYADFYARDWMSTNARIEIFVIEDHAEEVATAIMDAAHLGMAGDGIVAIQPVEKLYQIRTRAEAVPHELKQSGSE